MPRPELEWEWQDRIYGQAANHEGRGGHYIRARLVEAFGDVSGLPARKTVDKYLTRYASLPEEVRKGYRAARWPESMQTGLLPWEAAPATLELLRMFEPYRTGQRPSIRLARWFWRLTLAAPDLPPDQRRNIAGHLAAAEALGDMRQARAIEAFLLYRGWTDSGLDQWIEALRARQAPAWPPPDFEGHLALEAVEDLVGPLTPEQRDRYLAMLRGNVETETGEKAQEGGLSCGARTKAASTGAKTAAGQPSSASARSPGGAAAKRSTARPGKRSRGSSPPR